MTSNSKKIRLAGLGLLGALLLVSCDTTLPPAIPYNPVPPTYTPVYDPPYLSSDRLTVADFETGLSNINVMLFNPSNPCAAAPTPTPTVGCYAMALPGSVTFINNFKNGASACTIFGNFMETGVYAPGADNTSYAFHAKGRVTDAGDGKYPTLDLQAQMNSGAIYDASFFSGVRFYLKVMPADDATKRVFAVPIFDTQKAPSGGCTTNCYDHFFVSYDNTGGAWRIYNVDFLSMGRQGFGAALSPNTLSGPNLKQVLWLMWQEGRNNTSGTSEVDFWVDSIEFY